MENSMQNASEKMVPIDTSGDPVEVELNDEKEKEEVVGNHYLIIFEKDEQLQELIQKVELEQERLFETEFTIKPAKKKISVNLSCSPVFDDHKNFSGIVIAVDDLSKINKVKSTFKKYV